MASVRKRGKIYYVYYNIKVVDVKGELITKQVAKPVGPDKQIADRVAAEKTIEVLSERYGITRKNVPIEDFYNDYKDKYSKENKRPNTIKGDDRIWKTFKRLCPEIRIAEQFTDKALESFITRRRGSPGPKKIKILKATVNRELGLLKSLAKWGYRKKYLAANYYDLIDRLPEDDSVERKPFENDNQFQRVLDSAKPLVKAAVILANIEGLRRGEMCFLEKKDFDWINRTITVDNKPHLNWKVKSKDSRRVIPIHDDAYGYLKYYYDNISDPSSPFFLTNEWGLQMKPDRLTRLIRHLFRKLEIPSNITLHSGRHNMATRIQQGGASDHDASKFLGHHDPKITRQVYTHFEGKEHFPSMKNLKYDVDFSVNRLKAGTANLSTVCQQAKDSKGKNWVGLTKQNEQNEKQKPSHCIDGKAGF